MTQHIARTGETTFPVTADPLWLPGWLIYLVGKHYGIGAASAMAFYRITTQGA